MLTICTGVNTEGTGCACCLVLEEKHPSMVSQVVKQSLHAALETTFSFKVHYSKYSIRKCQAYVCVDGSGGAGVNSSHSSLSVGGEAHRSIKTAHQCPYKRLASRYAYRAQRVPVLPLVHDKSHAHTRSQKHKMTSTTLP